MYSSSQPSIYGVNEIQKSIEKRQKKPVAISVGGILESAGVVGTFVEACEDGEEGPVIE